MQQQLAADAFARCIDVFFSQSFPCQCMLPHRFCTAAMPLLRLRLQLLLAAVPSGCGWHCCRHLAPFSCSAGSRSAVAGLQLHWTWQWQRPGRRRRPCPRSPASCRRVLGTQLTLPSRGASSCRPASCASCSRCCERAWRLLRPLSGAATAGNGASPLQAPELLKQQLRPQATNQPAPGQMRSQLLCVPELWLCWNDSRVVPGWPTVWLPLMAAAAAAPSTAHAAEPASQQRFHGCAPVICGPWRVGALCCCVQALGVCWTPLLMVRQAAAQASTGPPGRCREHRHPQHAAWRGGGNSGAPGIILGWWRARPCPRRRVVAAASPPAVAPWQGLGLGCHPLHRCWCVPRCQQSVACCCPDWWCCVRTGLPAVCCPCRCPATTACLSTHKEQPLNHICQQLLLHRQLLGLSLHCACKSTAGPLRLLHQRLEATSLGT